MPDRRTDAPVSFGAPLDELLPRLHGGHGAEDVKLQVRRARAGQPERDPARGDECPVFMLNQSLFEGAKKER